MINPAFVTETVRQIAAGVPVAYPVLADALEEAGCTDAGLLLDLRRDGIPSQTTIALVAQFASGFDFSVEWDAAEAAEARKYEKARARVVLFNVGVTGCTMSLAELQTRITRKRPRGSGSKAELAKRLSEKMDELAQRRWDRAIKGQRKATERQATEAIAAIEAALESVQSRATTRTLSVSGAIAAARAAANSGYGERNGGVVTANSYGYSWQTTTATASRMPNGCVRVSISRSAGHRVAVEFPARVWATLEANREGGR